MYAQYSSDIINFGSLLDPTDQWELVERIGEGTYGEVHIAKHLHTGDVIAMKIMESIHEVVEEIEVEYRVLKELCRHPNLPDFHGIYLKQDAKCEDQVWLGMQLCSGGSVTDVVKAQVKAGQYLQEPLLAHILKETLKALNHLHKNHVMHRDIKGHNILFTSDAQVKIIDFGVSGHLKNTLGRRNTSVGTPFWMAPEVIACEQQIEYDYDIRCDIWSLGVTAIELADGEPPLADLHPMRALFRIPRDPPPTFKKPEMWSEQFRDFISKCCVKDFEHRPFTGDLLKHPFIQQVPENTEEISNKLVSLIRAAGSVIHEPYVTTKHGRLRSKRKSKREPISAVDDLATLDVLEEVKQRATKNPLDGSIIAYILSPLHTHQQMIMIVFMWIFFQDIIVQHLFNRYNQEKIYTYIGDILLAINPFTPLTIYSDEFSKLYRNAGKRDNPPHIFAIADQSYQAMMHQKHNQCIVISGESGSGKTESANFLVQQLTLLGRAPNRTLEDKILQVNPLVEAFGNAKTVINDNSSRFGKYLEMTFTANGKVTGARLSEYLLEKSRVVSQAVGEKNFHIMYYVHDGLSSDGKQTKFHLNDKDGYRYLNGHTARDVSATSINRVKFKAIQNCFETIGFKSQEVNSVYSILAGILHIGNVNFEQIESKHENHASTVSTMELLKTVSELLGIDARELSEALTTSGMVARGETIVRNHTVQEAVSMRDAMAKALYGRLFSWIVNKINQLLKPGRAKSAEDESVTIGILDIFGFENFKQNSFEQLCINIANEQIQYYFNQHIFAWEQQEYRNEGIAADEVAFVDNRPVLDMFLMKPVGVLALLDEESNFPKATDLSLVEKFNQNIHSPHFEKMKSAGLIFIVHHYAGKVVYNADGILEKNRDRLAPEVVNVLRLSQIAMVRSLFHNPLTKTGNLAYSTLGSCASSVVSSPSSSVASALSLRSAAKGSSSQNRSQQTTATYFRYSLMDLLSKMVAGTPLFVRCIRPNLENVSGFFDTQKVLTQLTYTGVLETTRIRRQGYSHRIPFSEFLKRYYILGFNWHEKIRVNKESCQTLLQKLGLENWALGKTKVFLKYYHIEQLSRKFEEYNGKLVLTQAVLRTFLQKKRFQRHKEELTKSATVIQRYVRGHLARETYVPKLQKRHDAIVQIQARTRGYQQRRRYKSQRDHVVGNVVKIQTAYRGYHARRSLKLRKLQQDESKQKAVIVLQKNFRMWQCQSEYLNLQMQRSDADRQATQLIHDIENRNVEMVKSLHRNSNLVTAKERRTQMQSPSAPLKPPRVLTHQPLASVSQERLQKMARVNNVKTPWTEEDSAYYDKLNKENRTRAMRGKLKSLTSAEGRAYYNKIMADFDPSLEENGPQMNGAGHPEKASDKIINSPEDSSSITSPSSSLGKVESVTEVDEMLRSVMATSAATTLMANKPLGSVDIEDPYGVPPGRMPKSESEMSLPWDAPLTSAREHALAPDDNQFDVLEVASDISAGTSVTLDQHCHSVETMVATDNGLQPWVLHRYISDFSSSDRSSAANDSVGSDLAERGSQIEADDKADMMDVLQEQAEQREAMLLNLEVQRKNSLSGKFHRWKRLLEQQELRERRWENLVEQARNQRDQAALQAEGDKGSTSGSALPAMGKKSWGRALSSGSSSGSKFNNLVEGVQKQNSQDVGLDNQQSVDAQQNQVTNSTESTKNIKNLNDDTNNNQSGEASDDSRGKFNFRVALRKVHTDPSKTLRKSPDEVTSPQYDFRHVLKKKTASQEAQRLKRHIEVNP